MAQLSPNKQRALTIGMIVLGVIVAVFFGMRAFRAFNRFNGHRPPPQGKVETDVELIRGWMTVPFISQMYRVPDRIIFEELNIPEKGNMEKSLKDLNQEYYPNEDGFVIEMVKQIVQANLPNEPHDPPEPPTPPNP
ncbi:MAG TPA: hypothetical protein PLE39_00740 [Anaerolineales bacterium]|nr:hypothetical protein [Anaerolineales bacterium]HNE66877.1 hypothetical protein [Anaerolineales bacterium]